MNPAQQPRQSIESRLQRIDREQKVESLTGVRWRIVRADWAKACGLVESDCGSIRRKHFERDGFQPEISGPRDAGCKQLLSVPSATKCRGYPHAPDDCLFLIWPQADAHHGLRTAMNSGHKDRAGSACERSKSAAPRCVIEGSLAFVARIERSAVTLQRPQPNGSVYVHFRRSQLPHDHASQSNGSLAVVPSRF